jgi:hypothetical protein
VSASGVASNESDLIVADKSATVSQWLSIAQRAAFISRRAISVGFSFANAILDARKSCDSLARRVRESANINHAGARFNEGCVLNERLILLRNRYVISS